MDLRLREDYLSYLSSLGLRNAWNLSSSSNGIIERDLRQALPLLQQEREKKVDRDEQNDDLHSPYSFPYPFAAFPFPLETYRQVKERFLLLLLLFAFLIIINDTIIMNELNQKWLLKIAKAALFDSLPQIPARSRNKKTRTAASDSCTFC